MHCKLIKLLSILHYRTQTEWRNSTHFSQLLEFGTPKKQLYTFTKVLGEHRVKKDRKLFFSVALQAQQYQQQESQHKSHAYLDQCLQQCETRVKQPHLANFHEWSTKEKTNRITTSNVTNSGEL